MGLVSAWWLLSLAAGLNRGLFWPLGVWLVVAAATLIFLPRRWLSGSIRQQHLALWVGSALNTLLAFCGAAFTPGLMHTEAGGAGRWIAIAQLVMVAVITGYGPSRQALLSRRARRCIFFVIVGITTMAGAWAIAGLPDPNIDVYNFLSEGAWGLLQGRNPYAMEFTPVSKPVGPGYIDLAYHYVYSYLPGTLLLTLPSVLLGDVRWVMLAAVLASAFLLRSLSRRLEVPEPVADSVAIAFLTYPGLLCVVQNAWPEPLIVCLWLAALWTVVSARPSWAVGLSGLFLAIKQYNPPLAIPLLGAGIKRRQIIASLLIPASLCAVFIAWGPRDFLWDAFLYQVQVPARPDALSLSAYLLHTVDLPLPGWVGLAVPAIALGYAFRAVLKRQGLAQSLRLTAGFYLSLFLFNKFAFANYYFLLQSILVATIAAGIGQSHRRNTTDDLTGSKGSVS